MARPLLAPAALVAVALLLCATSVQAHICLTYPMMRGPHPDLYPGDSVCYQRTPDCGALVKGNPTATFVAGTPTSIQFQQNLNHWYMPEPGHFDLAISYDEESTWEMLGSNVYDFPANNMNTQTFFNVPVTFPRPAASAVVRARYVSNNPDEIYPANNTKAIFYSCADVEIIAPGNWGPGMLKAAMKPAAEVPKLLRQVVGIDAAPVVGQSCMTPSRWMATGTEYDFQGNGIMSHSIAYDTVASMIRWDRNNSAFGGMYAMTDYWNLTMLSAGYTPQYIAGLKGPNTCSLYGGDAFFPWQYGAQNGMKWLFNETYNGETFMHFKIATNGMWLQAKAASGSSTCLPVSWSIGQNRIDLKAHAVTSIPAGTFTLPTACSQQAPDAGCWAHRLKKHE